jgi:predicted nuclease with RNAse H fold
VGLDLSGPTNLKDTAVVVFRETEKALVLEQTVRGASDPVIHELTAELAAQGSVTAGLDAPLSYNPGGGDRPGDRKLRAELTAAGLPSGSVMTPTMTRMAYLTLRGISLARGLEDVGLPRDHILETHPGGALVLRGAPLEAVRHLNRDPAAGILVLRWLEDLGLQNAAGIEKADDHLVMACAAVLAAWKYRRGDPAWLEQASPPEHPYHYVC